MSAEVSMRAAERAAHIAALVAAAPPLTSAQQHIILTAFAGATIVPKSRENAA